MVPSSPAAAAAALGDAWSRGLRTAVAGSWRPDSPWVTDVLVATARLDHVVRIDVDNSAAVVEAGTTIDQLRQATDSLGLWCPGLRWLRGEMTIGAAIAGAHGHRSAGYGAVADYLLGSQFIAPAVGLARHGGLAIKNATGYNLSAMVVGSRGCLGILVEVVLRLAPRPLARQVSWFEFADGPSAVGCARVLAGSLGSKGLEALDLAAVTIALPGSGGPSQLRVEIDGLAPDSVRKRTQGACRIVQEHRGVECSSNAWPGLTGPTRWSGQIERTRLADLLPLVRGGEPNDSGWLIVEATGGGFDLVTDGHSGESETRSRLLQPLSSADQRQLVLARLKESFDPNGFLPPVTSKLG